MEIQQKRLPATTMMALGQKQDPREDLCGKKVVVVGLGTSGRSAVKLALARGADVVAVDKNEHMHPLELEEEFARYGPDRLRTELGPHQIKTFMDADKLVVSPGVPVIQPAVAAALESGVAAVSELGFAAEVLPKGIKLAAVTGTNGKSTVTSFTGQILSQAGIRTFVGGNLGTPLCEAAWQCLSFPAKDPPFHAAIVEVSSYQLELPGVFAPTVGVILNLTPDHLERHKTMENYGMIKCRLFSKMSPLDVSVIPWGSSLLRHIAAKSHGASTRAWLGALPGVQLDSQARRAIVVVPTTGAEARLHLETLNVVGMHNAHNVGTAAFLALALDIGVDEIRIQSALPELEALPHRMQIVCQDKRGVQWINDSKATNVEATFTGIRGIVGKTAVILLGGLGKAAAGSGDLGFSRLVEVIKHHRAVVTFGTSGNKIKEELHAAGITIPLVRVENLSDAVHAAQSLARSGDTILLSPGCASFDEFSDFEHRGRVFTQLAKQHSSRK